MQNLKRAARFVEVIGFYSAIASAVALWGIFGLVLYGLTMRYVFRNPPSFILEGPAYLFLVLVMLMLAHVQHRKEHIGVTVFVDQLPARLKKVTKVVTLSLFLAFCALIIRVGWWRTLLFLQQGDLSVEMRIPLWIVALFVPVGAIILFLQVASDLVRSFSRDQGKG